MNAIQFIDSLDSESLNNLTAQEAYIQYENRVGSDQSGTYNYFRTKFNTAAKNQNSDGAATVLINPSRPITMEELEEEELPVLRTRNYMQGDILPDCPNLIRTGTIFDELISDRINLPEDIIDWHNENGEHAVLPTDMSEQGGFTRKCADIVAGDPGAGKTWSRCMLAVKAKQYSREVEGKEIRVGFISAEMRESEWAKELKKSPMLAELEVEYMLEHVGYSNYEQQFWAALRKYDIVIIDSLPAVLSHMKMSMLSNDKRTEKVLIFEFIREILKLVEECDNNVQVINQANKDGSYKGGTELPHMLSSLSFVKLDDRERYMVFIKNRNNGNVKRKLYFSKNKKTGDIEFNEEVFNATYKQVEDKSQTLAEFMDSLPSDEPIVNEEIKAGDQYDLVDSIVELENNNNQ